MGSVTHLSAQSIVGIWKTIDDTDNVEKSHIEIYQHDGLYYGKVIKLLEGATVEVCTKCKGDKKGQHLVGMILLENMEKSNDQWKGGQILDPASGKSYKCYLELETDEVLKVRGYLGIPAFGRTQYWYRVKD
jgi:uncharacterized protein (DUF2147 family)